MKTPHASLALTALALASAAAPAQAGCAGDVDDGGWRRISAWCQPSGRRSAPASLALTFIQDSRDRAGDTDRYGDRQGGEAILRLPASGLGLSRLGGSDLVLGLRSSVDTGQAVRLRGGRLSQYDQVPAFAVVGLEGDVFAAYVVGGTVNAAEAVDAWRGLKLWEHSLAGPRRNRTSPLTSGEGVLAGLQGRADDGMAVPLGKGWSLAMLGTAFGQSTTVKVEAGGAIHLAVGDWDGPPRPPVSDLPAPAMLGTGVWIGVEGSGVAGEAITARNGTQALRGALVAGASLSLGDGMPSLSLTARRMMTEQARGPGTRAWASTGSASSPHWPRRRPDCALV